MSRDDDQPFLDDPDDLALRELEADLEAEAREEREAKVEAVAKALDEAALDELDSLLSESVTLASARKRKAQGRKLDLSEAEALERQRIAEEIAAWEPKCGILHVVHTVCTACEAQEYQIRELFELYHHRKSNARKLTKVTETALPAFRYDTVEEVAFCTECLNLEYYEFADPAEHPILTSLGEPAEFDDDETESDLDFELRALETTIEEPKEPQDADLSFDRPEGDTSPTEAPSTVAPSTLPLPLAVARFGLAPAPGQGELEVALGSALPRSHSPHPQLLADAGSVAVCAVDGDANLGGEVSHG